MIANSYFSNIRRVISTHIQKAKKNISIAVCWFTNQYLFDLLLIKLRSGLQVELIILDDLINCNQYACNFSEFIHAGGQLYLANSDAPMHNKYCIIDDLVLISGSYNWTYFAESRNEENILVLEDLPELINQYILDFKRLKTKYELTKTYQATNILAVGTASNSLNQSPFNFKEMLANDLFLKSFAIKNSQVFKIAQYINPATISAQKEAVKLNWIKARKLISTLSESIEGDGCVIVFPKDSLLPAEANRRFRTIADDQTKIHMNLRYGEHDKASLNKILKSYILEGLPPAKAGLGSISSNYKLTTDGILYIIIRINGTNSIVRHAINLNESKLIQ